MWSHFSVYIASLPFICHEKVNTLQLLQCHNSSASPRLYWTYSRTGSSQLLVPDYLTDPYVIFILYFLVCVLILSSVKQSNKYRKIARYFAYSPVIFTETQTKFIGIIGLVVGG